MRTGARVTGVGRKLSWETGQALTFSYSRDKEDIDSHPKTVEAIGLLEQEKRHFSSFTRIRDTFPTTWQYEWYYRTTGYALTKVKKIKKIFNKQPVCRAALQSSEKLQRVLIFLKQHSFNFYCTCLKHLNTIRMNRDPCYHAIQWMRF